MGTLVGGFKIDPPPPICELVDLLWQHGSHQMQHSWGLWGTLEVRGAWFFGELVSEGGGEV